MVESADSPRQFATVPRAFNFRDLGGIRTASGKRIAKGRVYRGASLHLVERASIPPLSTVVDLRCGVELRRGGTVDATDDRIVLNHPVLKRLWGADAFDQETDLNDFLVDRYLEMLVEGEGAIRCLILELARLDRLPVAYFCAAGKDRTGVVTAILLGSLGVETESIVADYAKSEPEVRELFDWLTANRPSASAHADLGNPLLASPAAAMRGFLAAVDERFGGSAEYLRDIGVEAETLGRLEENLT